MNVLSSQCIFLNLVVTTLFDLVNVYAYLSASTHSSEVLYCHIPNKATPVH